MPSRSVPPKASISFYRSDGTGRDSYIRNHNGGLLGRERIHSLLLTHGANNPTSPLHPVGHDKETPIMKFGNNGGKNGLIGAGSAKPIAEELSRRMSATDRNWVPAQKLSQMSDRSCGPASTFHCTQRPYAQDNHKNLIHYVSDGSGRDFYIAKNDGGYGKEHRWRDRGQFWWKEGLREGRGWKKPENPQSGLPNAKSSHPLAVSLSQTKKRLSAPKQTHQPPSVETYLSRQFNSSVVFRGKQWGRNTAAVW